MTWKQTVGLGIVFGVVGAFILPSIAVSYPVLKAFTQTPPDMLWHWLAGVFDAHGDGGFAFILPAYLLYYGCVGGALSVILKLVLSMRQQEPTRKDTEPPAPC